MDDSLKSPVLECPILALIKKKRKKKKKLESSSLDLI